MAEEAKAATEEAVLVLTNKEAIKGGFFAEMKKAFESKGALASLTENLGGENAASKIQNELVAQLEEAIKGIKGAENLAVKTEEGAFKALAEKVTESLKGLKAENLAKEGEAEKAIKEAVKKALGDKEAFKAAFTVEGAELAGVIKNLEKAALGGLEKAGRLTKAWNWMVKPFTGMTRVAENGGKLTETIKAYEGLGGRAASAAGRLAIIGGAILGARALFGGSKEDEMGYDNAAYAPQGGMPQVTPEEMAAMEAAMRQGGPQMGHADMVRAQQELASMEAGRA